MLSTTNDPESHNTGTRPHPKRDLLAEMGVTGVSAFIAAAVTTWLYSLIVHQAGSVDWDTAILLGVVCGVALPLSHLHHRRA